MKQVTLLKSKEEKLKLLLIGLIHTIILYTK